MVPGTNHAEGLDLDAQEPEPEALPPWKLAGEGLQHPEKAVDLGELGAQLVQVGERLAELPQDRLLGLDGLEQGALLGVDVVLADGATPDLRVIGAQHAQPDGLRDGLALTDGDAVVPRIDLAVDLPPGVQRVPPVVPTEPGQPLGSLGHPLVESLGQQKPDAIFDFGLGLHLGTRSRRTAKAQEPSSAISSVPW